MTKQTAVALSLLICAASLWLVSDDLIELILKEREVLLGRYSSGGFGARLLLSLIIGGLGLLLLNQKQSVGTAIGSMVMISVSTVITLVLFVYAASFMKIEARYVEREITVSNTDAGSAIYQTAGVTRHRLPNKRFELTYADEPVQHRSFPNAPSGYPAVDIVLTSDQYGFRNQDVKEQYETVVVGDSFVAGSQVSDEQAWVSLLNEVMNRSIYNMGVSGSDPRVYLNNYLAFGSRMQPNTVIMMVYAGNDFKSAEPVVLPSYEAQAYESSANHVASPRAVNNADADGAEQSLSFFDRLKFSPVIRGYKAFSRGVLEKIGANRPVPEYASKASWMPLAIQSPTGTQYYSFKPKRLASAYHSPEEWLENRKWQATSQVFLEMKQITEQRGQRFIMVWAPSKPQVVLAAANAKNIGAEQLHLFGSYRVKNIPDAATFKRNVFAWLNSQEQVFMAFCQKHDIECVSTAPALIAATKAGQQTYFTYDQHWTPIGNEVVAELMQNYLRHPEATLK